MAVVTALFTSGMKPRAGATEEVPVELFWTVVAFRGVAADSELQSVTSYGQVTTHGHCESLIEGQEAGSV